MRRGMTMPITKRKGILSEFLAPRRNLQCYTPNP